LANFPLAALLGGVNVAAAVLARLLLVHWLRQLRVVR
jgi:hypothetical protein